jgi:hypothetical protein
MPNKYVRSALPVKGFIIFAMTDCRPISWRKFVHIYLLILGLAPNL